MNVRTDAPGIRLPDDLRERLLAFRRRLRRVKTAEAVLAAWAALALSFVAVFLLDRAVDTPSWLRAALLGAGACGFLFLVPARLHRWVWRSRRLEQVARILRMRHARLGDRLLGTVELAAAGETSSLSPALCRAAIAQVAEETRHVNLLDAVPVPRHRRWAALALGVTVVATGALVVPGAGVNALARWLAPFGETPRFTFAQLEAIPERLVVPLAEPFVFEARLRASSPWKPHGASARYASQERLHASREDGAYRFDVPPQTAAGTLSLRTGDARASLGVMPLPRPEITALEARIELPAYLEAGPRTRDARAGSVAILTGSRVVLAVRTSRALAAATLDGEVDGVTVADDRFLTPALEVTDSREHELRWVDREGLSSSEPFVVRISAVEDFAPLVSVDGFAPEQVVLVDEVVGFQVAATDDYGVRRAGVEWTEIPDPVRNPAPEHGEYELAAGGPEKSSLALEGAFHAQGLGIAPQSIHLRVWVEDYLPGRERVYSPVFRLYVLSPEEHMIWVTENLQRWERHVLEVRDEEHRLHGENRELSELGAAELAEPSHREAIARQAARERANAQRLGALAAEGDALISEAARNDEFNASTLERWAETLRTIKDIAARRMPSVASLLAQAAGRQSAGGKPPEAPSVSDAVEGARRDPGENPADPPDAPPAPSSAGGRLTLPTTTLPGGSPPPGAGDAPPPAAADENPDLAAAVEEQAELLAEFERVLGELQKILQELHGSTFVKRLKHAARQEKKLASTLGERLERTFAATPAELAGADREDATRLAVAQSETATQVSYIQDDLSAYFDRTKEPKFEKVYREMRAARVVEGLEEMSTAARENRAGETIAQAEFWVDELDRWAEILVGPG